MTELPRGFMQVNHVLCPNCRTLHAQFFGNDEAIVCGCGTTIANIEINEKEGYIKASIYPKGHDILQLSYVYNHAQDDTRPPSLALGEGDNTPPY